MVLTLFPDLALPPSSARVRRSVQSATGPGGRWSGARPESSWPWRWGVGRDHRPVRGRDHGTGPRRRARRPRRPAASARAGGPHGPCRRRPLGRDHTVLVSRNPALDAEDLIRTANGHDVEQRFETLEVLAIACGEARSMCTCGPRDQEVHRSGPWSTTYASHLGRQQTMTLDDSVVDRQRIEPSLDRREATQSPGPAHGIVRHEHAEVRFGGRDDTDREVAFAGRDIRGDDHARVEDDPHSASQGWRKGTSRRSRSSDQPGSGGPEKRSRISSKRRHRRESARTNRAAGRPLTVMVISSPASTRRTKSLACCLSSRGPTTSTGRAWHRCYPPACRLAGGQASPQGPGPASLDHG